MMVGSRELNLVLFGELVDDVDCRERFDRAWDKLIEGCVGCTLLRHGRVYRGRSD